VQFTKAIDDAADLAVRVIDLLQGVLDFLDRMLGEPDQHGRRIRLQQFGQGLDHLIDIPGIGADLAPVDEATNLHGIVNRPPECLFGVAATVCPLRLEQERLEEPIVALGDVQQHLDQGFGGLRFQKLSNILPWVTALGLGRLSSGALGRRCRSVLAEPCQSDRDAMLAEIAVTSARAGAVAGKLAVLVPEFDLIGFGAFDFGRDLVFLRP
jgi:hypothetical protein